MFPLFFVWMVSFLASFFPDSFGLLLLLIHICPHSALSQNLCNRTVSMIEWFKLHIDTFTEHQIQNEMHKMNFVGFGFFLVFFFRFHILVVLIGKIARKPNPLNHWSKVDCRNWKWSTTCYNSFTIETTTLPICQQFICINTEYWTLNTMLLFAMWKYFLPFTPIECRKDFDSNIVDVVDNNTNNTNRTNEKKNERKKRILEIDTILVWTLTLHTCIIFIIVNSFGIFRVWFFGEREKGPKPKCCCEWLNVNAKFDGVFFWRLKALMCSILFVKNGIIHTEREWGAITRK